MREEGGKEGVATVTTIADRLESVEERGARKKCKINSKNEQSTTKHFSIK